MTIRNRITELRHIRAGDAGLDGAIEKTEYERSE